MAETPEAVLSAAGRYLGAAIVAAEPLEGGYTPQQILRLRLDDGGSIVLKAAPPSVAGVRGPNWGETLKREIRAYRDLVELRDWMPLHLGDFMQDGWQVLLLEDLTGAERIASWSDRTIDLVARGLASMHRKTLGTAPASPHASFFDSIAERGRVIGDLPAGYDHPDWWEWLEEATAAGDLALRSLSDQTPRSLVHFDVRSDNIFLRDEQLLLVDWPDATWQTPAVDSVYWALGVEVETGRDAREVHSIYSRYLPELDEQAIRYTLAFCLGCFIESSQRGGVPQRLVEMRRRFIVATAPWFSDLCGIGLMPAPAAD